jgi:hypothetical protein
MELPSGGQGMAGSLSKRPEGDEELLRDLKGRVHATRVRQRSPLDAPDHALQLGFTNAFRTAAPRQPALRPSASGPPA